MRCKSHGVTRTRILFAKTRCGGMASAAATGSTRSSKPPVRLFLVGTMGRGGRGAGGAACVGARIRTHTKPRFSRTQSYRSRGTPRCPVHAAPQQALCACLVSKHSELPGATDVAGEGGPNANMRVETKQQLLVRSASPLPLTHVTPGVKRGGSALSAASCARVGLMRSRRAWRAVRKSMPPPMALAVLFDPL
jgi:hypothetical protein